MADPELRAMLQQAMAARAAAGGGTQSQAAMPIIPMWQTRPKGKNPFQENVNVGQFGDARTEGGGRVLTGRPPVDLKRDVLTADAAASSFLDMDQADRDNFQKLAIEAGLIKVGQDGFVTQDEVFGAWQQATKYAGGFNSERDKDKWISPWEAAQRLALSNEASGGKGKFDPFAPRTSTATTHRNFSEGQDAEGVTRNLENLFASEMGRAPTQEERAIYQRLVQKAYDANPERTTSVTQTDAQGNSTTNATQSGGIDMTATLLDKVRSDPEQQAFQAGSTFFSAAMQALGAIA